MTGRRVRAGLPGLAAAAGLAWSCASAPGVDRPPVAGCYQFEERQDVPALGLPWGVILEDAPLERGWPLMEPSEDVRRARTATSPTARSDHPFGYWRWTPADSLEVGYPGGGALVLTLAPRDRDLVGTAQALGDARAPGEPFEPQPARPVVARRVPCGPG